MGMRISKLLPVVCALAAGATVLTARADDNQAQAAARAALGQQMPEVNAQPSTNAAMASTDANVVMAPVDKKAAKAKAKADKAAAAAKAKEEQAAAAQATRDAQLKAVNSQPAPLLPSSPASVPAASPEIQVQTVQTAQTTVDAAAKQGADKKVEAELAALAAAGAASTNTTAQVQAPPANPSAPAPAPSAKPAEGNYVGKDLGMKPIASPDLPISAAKASQLQALLAKYKADQISPEEYHKQRAAILAEP